MEQILLETILKVIGSSRHGFVKGKSYLANLVAAFYNEMISLVDNEKTEYVVYLDFSKAFNTVFCKIFIDKLMKHRLDKWTVKWTENWMKCQAQRVVISGTKSS
ncbi:rna-directed dna polymerase from mobile element jockey- hypothetical protein [Limosa lapponica baueri]|uniref:Uncharacterized protein n=1 Tax=Limosa lapponica baueri TaxID=1758121 RepID=A0A2I0THS8_LIMLA|nr:rna-directed dna polymerase from mobile element jockey- hypothetical protein [Limosa lapponica baueri]